MKFYFKDIVPYIPAMLQGLLVNIMLAVFAMVVGSFMGILLFTGKTGRHKWLSRICCVYIEIIRNTPLLVQLYLIYFGLAQLGLDVSAYVSALLAITLNNAAYSAEIFRGGFMAVRLGTVEAGHALGMTDFQVFIHVRLLPAIQACFPALINQFVMLFLFSSVASIIALPELTYVAMNTASKTALTFEVYLLTGAFYYVTCTILISVMRLCGHKWLRW